MSENTEVNTDINTDNASQVAPPLQQEKLLPQHQVNALVGSAKQKGYEKGYNEGLSARDSVNSVQSPQTLTHGQTVDPDTVRKIAQETFIKQQEELQKKALEEAYTQQGMQVLNQLNSKFNEAKQRLPDFDNVVKLQNFVNAPEVLHYANTVDNAGDVMYDLAKNPSKLANLTSLHRSGLTDYATQAIREISDSIKQNQNALSQPKTPEPLNQIKPSNIGLGNSSNRSVADMMRDPAYRG